MARFLTISGPGEGVVREKMSRFLAFAMPAATVEEARAAIADVANRYHDARHVCWAYMVGADRSTWLSSDNGEPSGTAGKPILGQINSLGLTNVAVAVVRYFGGIKLGTSGLIVAYREAAREALEAAPKMEGREMIGMTVTFAYPYINSVMKVAKIPDIKIIGQDFDNTCTMSLSLPLDIADEIRSRLEAIDSVTTA